MVYVVGMIVLGFGLFIISCWVCLEIGLLYLLRVFALVLCFWVNLDFVVKFCLVVYVFSFSFALCV